MSAYILSHKNRTTFLLARSSCITGDDIANYKATVKKAFVDFVYDELDGGFVEVESGVFDRKKTLEDILLDEVEDVCDIAVKRSHTDIVFIAILRAMMENKDILCGGSGVVLKILDIMYSKNRVSLVNALISMKNNVDTEPFYRFVLACLV